MIDLDRDAAVSTDVDAAARRRAWLASALWAALFLIGLGFLVSGLMSSTAGSLLFFVTQSAFAVAGIAILRRDARNVVAWILLAIGLGWTVSSVLEYYTDVALTHGWPGGSLGVALGSPLWLPPILLMGTSLLLRFPDGELPSPRWGVVERLALVVGVASFALILFDPGPMVDSGHLEIVNPIGIVALNGPVFEFAKILIVLLPLLIVASAVGLVIRFRDSRGVERLQLKWLVAAGAIVALVYLAAMIASIEVPWLQAATPGWIYALQITSLASFALIPIAIGIAILRYRLYGIDVVINRAFVYGSLAAFITAAYVGIVVGLGSLIGSARSPGLSIVATAVVAVAFQPVRTTVQRVANRMVYGKRAAPYDVLSNLSSRMTGAFGTDEVLPRVARLLVDGTGAARVEIWLRVGERLHLATSSPSGDDGMTDLIGVSDISVPPIPNATTSVPVRDEGELLGVIAMRKDAGDAMTPPEQALTEDVARQAALLLRNATLIEELRASRERIVAAQDDERRRLERDIHDGAQQQLVTLSLATRLAQSGLGPGAPQALTELLERAVDESKQALAELRELARGIHPRILTERGLPAAIRSLAERAPVPVTVEAAEGERLPEPIEATAYFAVSEALQNIAKYAQASAAEVRTFRENGTLVVRVSDDGVGGADPSKGSGLRGLLDRVDAVGGRLDVHSPDGEGTRVTISLPVAERAPTLAGAG